MNGGTVTTKVKFITYTKQKNGASGWEDIKPVLVLETFASRKQIRSTRTAENLQEGINAVYELKLYKRAGFTPQSDYSVIFEGNEHNIVGIEGDEISKKEWILTVVYRGEGI